VEYKEEKKEIEIEEYGHDINVRFMNPKLVKKYDINGKLVFEEKTLNSVDLLNK